MNIKLTQIESDIIIGGFSVETTLQNSAQDVGNLYKDFINNGKMQLLSEITKEKLEYYAVIWYTKLHEKYMYLLGQKLEKELTLLTLRLLKLEHMLFLRFHQNMMELRHGLIFIMKKFLE